MRVDCVIILGQSSEFHPLVTEDSPKFLLPFMNVPLLKLTLNYLSPFAAKIFIVCLEKHARKVQCIADSTLPIELFTTTSYEGMAFVLNAVKKKIRTNWFIMCKGDIYGLEPLNTLLESFIKSDDDIYTSVEKTTKNATVMCIDSRNYLKMYNSSDIPLLKNQVYTITKEYAMKDFFIIKTNCFDTLESSLYCFKNSIIPFLLQSKLKIRIGENMILQIRNISDYLTQLDLKNHLLGSSEPYTYNLIDPKCVLAENVKVEDSIIGANTQIGAGAIIKNSIIMDDVRISEECVIESCVLGNRCVIFKKSELKDCKVSNDRFFTHTIKATLTVFTKE